MKKCQEMLGFWVKRLFSIVKNDEKKSLIVIEQRDSTETSE